MADNVRLDEIIVVPHATSPGPNVNDIRQPSGLLMAHSSTPVQSRIPSILSSFNFTARTMEHSRLFANNISSTIQEIRPLIEHQPRITLGSLLNSQRNDSSLHNPVLPSDNYIINVEDQPGNSENLQGVTVRDNHHHHQTTVTDNFLSNIDDTTNGALDENPDNAITYNNNNNNNNSESNMEENSEESVQLSPEGLAMLRILQKSLPFVAILLMKALYDNRASVLNFVVLLVTFNHANNVVKREISKQNNKSWLSLLVVTCYIFGCIVFINVDYEIHIFSAYTQPLNIWDLLWSVLITDFVLKLITITCKVFLTCLPSRLLALRKRGKYYLMVEATSQLYRCVAPIQAWLYYFFEAYQGPEKVLGICFSLLYTVCKRSDLLSHIKLFCSAIRKLLQNVNLGVSPSKEQLVESGGICAICHDEYSIPVKLHCKHIFCETCVLTWLNRECSCPLCRAEITDDPIYRDGHTTHFIQLY